MRQRQAMMTGSRNSSLLRILFLITVLLYCFTVSFSQPPLPQRTLTVTATQPIHFGTFCVTGSGGGTVTVGWDGSRTATGNVALLALPRNRTYRKGNKWSILRNKQRLQLHNATTSRRNPYHTCSGNPRDLFRQFQYLI